MTKITDLTTKVTNGGTSERGRLSADEYNTLLTTVQSQEESIASLLTTVQSQEESIASLEESTIKNCGYFSTLEALQQAYPKAGAGSKAYVGSYFPYDIYLWDSSTMTWVRTNYKGGDESLDLEDYYTKDEQLIREELIVTQIQGNISDAIAEVSQTKVDKVNGKGLSTNDYTDEEKAKVEEAIEQINYYYIPLIDSGYVTSTPEGAITATSNAKNSGNVKIKNITRIRGRVYVSNTAYAIAFYDKDGKFLKDISLLAKSGKNTEFNVDVTAPEYAEAHTFIVSFYGAIVGYESYYCIAYSDGSLSANVNLDNYIGGSQQGTNLLIFGDSITENAKIVEGDDGTTSYENNRYALQYAGKYYNMWSGMIADYIKCTDLRNYALSGASYCDKQRTSGKERQNLSHQITLAIKDITPRGVFPSTGDFRPDIIIFALGVNDAKPTDNYAEAMSKTVLDANGDYDIDATLANLDCTKFNQAARSAFMRVKRQWSDARMLCLLPAQNTSREQAEEGVNNDLAKMAKRYGCEIIDMSQCGIVRDFEKKSAAGTLLKDGLHPTPMGQNLYAKVIVPKVKSMIFDSIFLNNMKVWEIG